MRAWAVRLRRTAIEAKPAPLTNVALALEPLRREPGDVPGRQAERTFELDVACVDDDLALLA